MVHKAGEQLHAIMARYQRNPWWFLGQDQASRAARAEVMWHRDLASVRGPTISATIRADCYESGRPPTISVDFVQKTAHERRAVVIGRLPTGEANTLLLTKGGRGQTLTIRVGLKGEGQPYGSLGLNSLRKADDAMRRLFLKGMRQSRVKNPLRGERLWWVEPGKTPTEATVFVFLLYLVQVGLVKTDTDPGIKTFLEGFIRRYGGRHIPREEAGRFYLIFKQMAKHFTVPQDWKSLTRYLKRVSQTEQATQQPSSWLQGLTGGLNVSERTARRWLRKESGLTRYKVALGKEIFDKLREKDKTRTERRLALQVLKHSGKSREAARKYLRRHLVAGETYHSIIKKVGSPSMYQAPSSLP